MLPVGAYRLEIQRPSATAFRGHWTLFCRELLTFWWQMQIGNSRRDTVPHVSSGFVEQQLLKTPAGRGRLMQAFRVD